ncbi:MAG: RNB domain-containing ribonuclease, partial [Cyanobacteria bacterium P01_A01_bin.17]
WHQQLQSCQRWAQCLNRNRRETGAMGGMETLSGAFLDENGRLVSDPDARYQSHQIIAEFMIAANTAAAQWLAKADCLALYRNHTAKEIAPGQDVMLQALLVLGSAQAIRNRLQNWLNRAEYSAALIGHFALTLWAYGHFTSPIRRLADLINHRIIKARLQGEEPPYSRLDLENLSSHINQATLAETQAAHTYYRNKAKAELRHQLASDEGFETLSAKELSRLLKHTEGQLPAALAEEVRSRLAQGQLQVLDYYLLLLKGQDSDLQQRVLVHLEDNIQDAASLLSLAVTQEATWSELNYTEQRQEAQFLAWAELEIVGE